MGGCVSEPLLVRLNPKTLGRIDALIAEHGSDELALEWSKATADLSNAEFIGLVLVQMFLIGAIRKTPTKDQFRKILREVDAAIRIMNGPAR